MQRIVLGTLAWLVFFACGTVCDAATSDPERTFADHLRLRSESPFRDLIWTGIGPYRVGGRVTDVESRAERPQEIWVGSASGGVWRSDDGGRTWASVFFLQSSLSIGDIALVPGSPDTVWIGSGESNPFHSVSIGSGVFKSVDDGRTWRNMGLRGSRHIGRVVVDPRNTDTVYVAALGNIYRDHGERGVFKTIDGGKTWQRVLFISERTGVVDLAMHPSRPGILYAAAWDTRRTPWNYFEGGSGSGIYRSEDGGTTWRRLTQGLPQGTDVGRIGLAISPADPRVVYALIDSQEPRPEMIRSRIHLDDIRAMTATEFLELDDDRLDLFLRENRAPPTYGASLVKDLVRGGQITPSSIARIFADAQQRRLNPYVQGAQVFRTGDGGDTWRLVGSSHIEGMYLTYGFYFGQIRVSPADADVIYLLGIPLLKSSDGGQTYRNLVPPARGLGREIVHRDCHALWIHPDNPDRLILGTDGGVNISDDGGDFWKKIANIPLAQCYTVVCDSLNPYRIYTGLQDNGVMRGVRSDKGFPGEWVWQTIWGGDGANVGIDPVNPDLVYLEPQFGHIQRLDFSQRTRKDIRPAPGIHEVPYRFNWLTPFVISRHHPGRLYLGTERVLLSPDRGDTWTAISPDLSRGKHVDGDVPYATITSLAESPIDPGLLCAGTDDGRIWVRRNPRAGWEDIGYILPTPRVVGVIASRHRRERLYVVKNGSQSDDQTPYLYRSNNLGLDWESLEANLPREPANVLLEDPLLPEVLYLGTDRGVYISRDAGGSWEILGGNLPAVPVRDMAIPGEVHDLVIATHGRGLFSLHLAPVIARVRTLKGSTPPK